MGLEERSAGAVVYYPEKEPLYLLLHYPGGHWDFPKGNIEAGETEEQAALREIKEETGLEVRLVPGFREVITYFYVRGGKRVRKSVTYFLAEAPSVEVSLSWEHRGYKWLRYPDALLRLTFDSTRRVLAKAHRYLTSLLRA